MSDVGDWRVLRYNSAAGKANGVPADSVFFQPDFASSGAGLNSNRVGFPIALEIGRGPILWVADPNNNRVLRLVNRDMVGANPRANAVIGFSDLVSLNQIDKLEDNQAGGSGLAHDATLDVLYISSQFRHHILVLEDGATGSGGICVAAVLGQPDLATTSSGLSDSKLHLPRHIKLDKGGRLWATDRINIRVVRFSPRQHVSRCSLTCPLA